MLMTNGYYSKKNRDIKKISLFSHVKQKKSFLLTLFLVIIPPIIFRLLVTVNFNFF